jgi:hypothetical protein
MDNQNQGFNTGFTEYKAEIAANGQRDFRSECMEIQPTVSCAFVMRA